jgi:hypothetical protein
MVVSAKCSRGILSAGNVVSMERKGSAVNHIALEEQDEAVKRFILTLPVEPEASALELDGKAVAWVVPASAAASNGDNAWTKEKNARRCDLIDRKYAGQPLTPAEALELAQLQEQMLRYRQRVAPLPLEDARRLHQELLDKAARAQADA